MNPFPYSIIDRVNQTHAPKNLEAPTFPAWVDLAVGPGHIEAPTKEGVPLFSPCHFNGPRSAKTVVRNAPIFVADADDYTEDTFLATIDRLDARGLEYACVSSWSHLQTKKNAPPRIRVRWLLLCDKPLPIDPIEYTSTWHHINHTLFEGLLDAGCKDVAHIYYQAAAPSEFLPEAIRLVVGGVTFALGSFSSFAPQGDIARTEKRAALETLEPVDPITLEKLFSNWKGKRNQPHTKALGDMGLKLMAGEPFAEKDRHNAIRALTKAIAQESPDALRWDSDSLGELWGASLDVTGDPHDLITRDEVGQLFDGAIEKYRGEALAAIDAESTLLNDWVNAAHPGRDGAFITPDEIEVFRKARGCSTDLIPTQLLLCAGKQIYVSTPDGGVLPTPITRQTVAGEGLRALSVFYPAIDPTEVLTDSEMLRKHAMTVDHTVYDYNVLGSTFDSRTKTLVSQAAKARQVFVDPKPHDECLEWIDLIDAHNKNTRFRDWLSAWNKLDQATAAVVAHGAADSGKTLPAFAVAEMYNAAPVPIDHITGDFSFALTSCPLVLGDETMGKSYYKSGSEFLRREITHPVRHVNRKFHDLAELKGFLRFWFAVNDLEVLGTNEDLNNASIDAFGERLALVTFPDESRDYLQALGGRKYIEANWKGKGSKLLETIAWLGETWESKSQSGRFYVTGSGEGSEFSQMFRSSQGSRHDVLLWLYSFLSWTLTARRGEGMNRFGHGEGLIFVEDGQIFLSSNAIAQHWDHAFKTPPPAPRVLQKAIAGLAEGPQTRRQRAGTTRRYSVIKPDVLLYRSDLSDLGPEGVQEALNKGSLHLTQMPAVVRGKREEKLA